VAPSGEHKWFCTVNRFIFEMFCIQANPNVWDGAERATPLFCAAAAEDSRCLAALLAAGADPNMGLHELGISALHAAASSNATKNMELLLQRGAEPNSVVLFR
jgi:ankyrin repeat protein